MGARLTPSVMMCYRGLRLETPVRYRVEFAVGRLVRDCLPVGSGMYRSSGPPFLVVILACMVAPNASTPGAIMLPTIAGIILLGALALASSVAAQSTPPPSAITRTVIAATKLLTVTEVPLYFRAVSVTIPPGEQSRLSAANGILYQMSGSMEVSGEPGKTLTPGEGLFIAAGRTATLKAGSSVPSTFLHFFLAPAADLDSLLMRRPPR